VDALRLALRTSSPVLSVLGVRGAAKVLAPAVQAIAVAMVDLVTFADDPDSHGNHAMKTSEARVRGVPQAVVPSTNRAPIY
jgi:hypothetical protein